MTILVLILTNCDALFNIDLQIFLLSLSGFQSKRWSIWNAREIHLLKNLLMIRHRLSIVFRFSPHKIYKGFIYMEVYLNPQWHWLSTVKEHGGVFVHCCYWKGVILFLDLSVCLSACSSVIPCETHSFTCNILETYDLFVMYHNSYCPKKLL